MELFGFFQADRANLAELYGKNTPDYYRGVFLSNLGRSFAAMLVLVHVIVLFPGTAFIDTQTKLWLAPFVGVLVLLLVASAWLVERGRHAAARKLTNFTISVSTMISVIICGGFIDSHATPFLLAPIVVCFCISPKREAMAVGGFTFFVPLIVDLSARYFGFDIPDLTSVADPTINTIFLMLTLFVTIFISLSFLQKTNDDLHEALNKEKQLYQNWASLDPLTEIGNRRYIDAELEDAVSHSDGSSQFTVLFIDLNGFKEINDRLGHETGDRILRTIATRLRDVLRDGDHLARFGGDEFVMLLSGTTASEAERYVTSKLHFAIERPIKLNGEEHRIRASVGKASFPADASSPSELLRAADMDMYAMKMAQRLANQHEQFVSRQAEPTVQTK